jgi:uracil-DNA glycosylase
MESAKILQDIAQQVSECTLCPLHTGRKKAVPGEGPANSEILFIGEGPGFYENEQGRPFVGAAGKFLDELLDGIHLKRSDVFITNVVKCRPPGNRDPEPEEISTCTGNYLFKQIEAINPRVIVTLGRFSMGLFLKDVRISAVHGKPVNVDGESWYPCSIRRRHFTSRRCGLRLLKISPDCQAGLKKPRPRINPARAGAARDRMIQNSLVCSEPLSAVTRHL